MHRYARQTILPQIGKEGQEKLLNSKILVIGAGGLGHPLAIYLTAMGIGQLEIIDGDQVHLTNLHRQILFTENDLGKNKAEVLAGKLSKVNKQLNVSFTPRFLDKNLAMDKFINFDVVVDCTDNFESKFLINDVCAYYDKPMVYGAISQFEGQVGVFWKSHGACYRCMYAEIPKSNIQNCAEAGVIGPVVGVIGSLQAMEVLKIIIDNKDLPPLFSVINYYDFCNPSFRNLKVPLRSTCLCHSTSFDKSQIAEVKRNDCSIDSSSLLVDVREAEEWNEFHIQGSYNFPLSHLEMGEIPNFEKNDKLILICQAGKRAQKAKNILAKLNFTNVHCSERGVYEY